MALGDRTAYISHFAEPRGYVDFARFGPVSRDVARGVSTLLSELSDGDVSTRIGELEAHTEDVRRRVAALTGRDGPEQVTLCSSTSAGLFHVAFALPRDGRGEVLVSAEEFPANVHPWLRAAEHGGPKVCFLPGTGPVTPARVAAAIRPRTVALAVSAVDYRTGYRCDLEGLRTVLGDRLLIIDGIQAFGVCHLDWGVSDVLVVGGQKWLRAGWGTGFVSLSARALDRLGVGLAGWRAMVDPMRLDIAPTAMRPQPTALRFLMTTPDLVAATSLGIALRLLAEVTEEVVDRVVSSHVARLCEGIQHIGGSLLVPLGPRDRSGIVSFHVPGHSLASIGDVLVARGLVVSVRADHVRISPHATTSSDVIDEVIDALATVRGASCR